MIFKTEADILASAIQEIYELLLTIWYAQKNRSNNNNVRVK